MAEKILDRFVYKGVVVGRIVESDTPGDEGTFIDMLPYDNIVQLIKSLPIQQQVRISEQENPGHGLYQVLTEGHEKDLVEIVSAEDVVNYIVEKGIHPQKTNLGKSQRAIWEYAVKHNLVPDTPLIEETVNITPYTPEEDNFDDDYLV